MPRIRHTSGTNEAARMQRPSRRSASPSPTPVTMNLTGCAGLLGPGLRGLPVRSGLDMGWLARKADVRGPAMCGTDIDTFKQIFRDHWETFKAAYPPFDTPDYNIPVQKMLDCGDPENMGYVQYRCVRCGEWRRIAFTCKSRFCFGDAQPRSNGPISSASTFPRSDLPPFRAHRTRLLSQLVLSVPRLAQPLDADRLCVSSEHLPEDHGQTA